jgi:hypothetical protein
MTHRKPDTFEAIRSEGLLLPVDLLRRVAATDKELGGLTPADYGLPATERLNEAIGHSWKRMLGHWAGFCDARAKLGPTDNANKLTHERWLLPLFAELDFGRLSAVKPIKIDDKVYAISHAAGEDDETPVHLLGWQIDLDTRVGSASPHGLLQELLNRSPNKQWGIVANGARLRVLRDSARLTRQAFLEFDLEQIFTGQLYADFAVLWLVCHASRLRREASGAAVSGEQRVASGVAASAPLALCWLERWSQTAQTDGTRALDTLRAGVETAISTLGQGFLSQRNNRALRDALGSGRLDKQDYYRQLLRLVYRLVFVCVAEERGLLLTPDAPADAAKRYSDFYSIGRLRRLSARRGAGGRHVDLWRGLALVLNALGRAEGCPELALPGLGGFLFSPASTPDLNDSDIDNQHLLDALRALSFTDDPKSKARRFIDYKHMGSEELGSVYESLLELQPVLNAAAGAFRLEVVAGSERKTTGSYYTRSDLVDALLDSALEPVVDARLAAGRDSGRRTADGGSDTAVGHPLSAVSHSSEHALLSLRICDAACGSGHFLIAAAHRVAKRLAAVRSGEETPPPREYQRALRDVISHCIYGVDINPMSVELCKVNLWLESLEPGKPLSFLDHHIQCGNSLIGATPKLIEGGVPDAAYTPIEGDDKTYCTEWKKKNKQFKGGQQESLFSEAELNPWDRLGDLPAAMARLEALDDDSFDAVRRKSEAYAEAVRGADYLNARLLADAWCAAFVFVKKPQESGGFAYPVTSQTLREIMRNPHSIAPWLRDEIRRLAGQYQFFHWHLAFPDVFAASASGERRVASGDDAPLANHHSPFADSGFDVMLGNPPWERIKLQEREWFAARAPQIAAAANAYARKKLIAGLRASDPALHAAFLDDVRRAEGESQFMRAGGRYPLTAVGDVNTYALFAELNRAMLNPRGRAGVIVPTGIATDDTTKVFFGDLVSKSAIASLYDFENREGLFPAVDSRMKFCLLTVNRTPVAQARFVFFATQVAQIDDPQRSFALSAQDVARVNPNTRTMPVFRTRQDAELTRKIYERVPVLLREDAADGNPWGITFSRMFDMSNDSGLFNCDPAKDNCLPLYEAKLLHQFDHRWATYAGADARDCTDAEKSDPAFAVTPRYWVSRDEVDERLRQRDRAGNVLWEWTRGWLLGFRRVARNTDERTFLLTALGKAGAGDSVFLILPQDVKVSEACLLVGCMNSLVFDYSARQKSAGMNLNFFYVKQFPVLPPTRHSPLATRFIVPRVLELTYTAHDLKPFAQDVFDEVGAAQWRAWFGERGEPLAPFAWDPERRAVLRAELDAIYARLYGLTRDELRYVLDPQDVMGPDFPGETFRVLKERELREYGEYRTRRLVLAAWDRLEGV